jgi:hypothetical protein
MAPPGEKRRRQHFGNHRVCMILNNGEPISVKVAAPA